MFLSLAHAIHLEASLRGEAVGADAGLVGHPGVPFYIVSWLALRAANVFGARGAEASDVLASAEGFFLASRIAAGVITAAGIAAFWRLSTSLTGPWRLVALLSFFAGSAWSLRYGVSVLGNETFAFPLSVALLWSVIYAARHGPTSCIPG